MSRSYKKNPVCTDGSPHTTKESKKFANKKVRGYEDLPDGSAYKKVSDSYDIHDFVIKCTWQEAKEKWEREEWIRQEFPTLKSYYRNWLKYYRSK